MGRELTLLTATTGPATPTSTHGQMSQVQIEIGSTDRAFVKVSVEITTLFSTASYMLV